MRREYRFAYSTLTIRYTRYLVLFSGLFSIPFLIIFTINFFFNLCSADF